MNGALPSWIERLLGIDVGPGEGTVWSIEHSWPWPPWVSLLFVAAAVAFFVGIYLREGRQASRRYRLTLAAIRLFLVAIVLLMLAQLTLVLKRTGLPYVAVVVDDTLSMTVVDHYEPEVLEELKSRVAENQEADISASEDNPHDNGSDELSRWVLARTLLTEKNGKMLSALADDYKLRLYYLSGVRPSGLADARASGASDVAQLIDELRTTEPTGEQTRLGEGVRRVIDDLRGSAPAAVVLLSDGINTEGPPLADAANLARRRGVPLFIVGLGSDRPVRDLKLSDLLVDPLVFVDDVVNFQAKLSGNGFAGKKVRLVLREENKPRELASLEVTIGPDGQPQTVRLPYRPTEVGQFRYVLEVEPQDGELQAENNRQTREVEVRKEKIRVLLVQAYPSYEFRYLKAMLGRDETVELNTVLQDADLRYAEQDSAALRVFPVRRDELFRYDVIILGDANPAMLSPSGMQNLADFVDQPEKGGALVLIAGPEFMPGAFRDTPLERLMPVELRSARYPDADQPITAGFRVEPTELGLASPPMQLGDTLAETRKIWQQLPELYWLLEVPDLRPAARVLAVDPTRHGPDGRPLPVIALQYVGAGKVLFHATDETWRWRRRVGDVFFARYWVQMIRYLSRSKLSGQGDVAALTSDRVEYIQGDPVRFRVRFADERRAPEADDGVSIVLQRKGQTNRQVRLHRAATERGLFEGVLNQLPRGSYHAWVAIPAMGGKAPAVDFSVVAPPGEFEHTQTETAVMQRAAELTNGRYYTMETARRLPKDLPPGHQVPFESLPSKPLWNRWPLVLLFLGLLIGEWLLRKWGGMV